jgi:hypothetical protein
MVFVAAVAVGLWGWVIFQKGLFYRGHALYLTPYTAEHWVHFFSLAALAMSWVVIGRNFIPPRADRKKWASRPGLVACFTIVVASVMRWLIALPGLAFVNKELMSVWPTVFWLYLHAPWPPNIAPALVAS